MPPGGGTTKNENISPSKGDSDLARDREGDVSVGCAGVAATETPPSACGAFPPLIRGILTKVLRRFGYSGSAVTLRHCPRNCERQRNPDSKSHCPHRGWEGPESRQRGRQSGDRPEVRLLSPSTGRREDLCQFTKDSPLELPA